MNGDDLGLCAGVNAGILEAYADGILTSTSMLVTTPFSAAAAELARQHPHLSVGLHVCLTDDRERFTVDPRDAEACRSELRRQVERFVELTGTLPTHLDSHNHVHRKLRPLFLELARELAVPLREHSSVRYVPSFYAQWKGETHPEWIGVEALERILRSEIQERVTELGCHPGCVDAELVSLYSHEREIELRTLCAPAIRNLVGELGITLIGFRDLRSLVWGASSPA